MDLHRFANPSRFLRLSARVLPWSTGLAVVLIGTGLYLGFLVAPADYQQGESVRIMYVHVPSAWMALFIYTTMAVASAVGLIWKHPLADLTAKSSAPIGAGFTFAALVTGSLWGQPMWGTWWVWDARLTSVLVILALVGFVNVPIIKFSVDWWNTLHQPASVLRMEGPSIDFAMLVPLLLMATGFTFYFASVLIVRIRSEIVARKIHNLRLLQVGG
jgi:heme exporter protein C